MAERLDWLVSVDDHIIEPPDLWVERMPAKDRDRVPQVQRINGVDTWVYEHHRTSISGILACAHTGGEFDPRPVNYEDLPRGYYDSKARLAEMDTDGVLAQLCFPFFPRFCGQAFNETQDKELALDCVRVYNDWVIEEWCGAAPGRFIPLIIMPLWDGQLAAAEIYRCAEKGAKAVTFSENPYRLKLPSLHSGQWDPVMAACNDTKMPLCLHIGSSSVIPETSPDAPLGVMAVMQNLNLAAPTVDWLYSGKLQKYPDLKIVLSEGGIGWIPYILERSAHVSSTYRYMKGRRWVFDPQIFQVLPGGDDDPDLFPDDPVRLFRDHIYGCFIEDYFGAANLEYVGIDNVMVETDYPHSDSSWPNSLANAHKMLAGLSDEDAVKVLRTNAMRVFDFTPAALP